MTHGAAVPTLPGAPEAPQGHRYLVDEDMARSTTAALRDAGYVVEDARDVGLRGQPDERVFAYAQARQAILVTADKGFANTLTYPLGTHAGIVVRIPAQLPTRIVNQELLRALGALRHEDLAGALVIVELGRVRIRRPA